MTQPSHWELGHILSIGTSGGRWHLSKPGGRGVALCGKFAYRQTEVSPETMRVMDWEAAPMCRTCQHIRSSK